MVLVYITVFEALERCARLEKGQVRINRET